MPRDMTLSIPLGNRQAQEGVFGTRGRAWARLARPTGKTVAVSISFRVDSDEEKAFRRDVHDWLEANLPAEMRGWSTRLPFDQTMWWYTKLHQRGWIAPHWPKQHGGMAATINQQIILREELARVGAPELVRSGAQPYRSNPYAVRHRGAKGPAPATDPHR